MKSPVLAAAAALACVAATAPAGAAAQAPLHYQCSSSTRSIDDTAYSGPWPDNWDVTISVCAARSGSTVHSYAEARWDGPTFYAVDDTTIFDGAKIRLQIKESRHGTDPLVAEHDFTGLEARLEDSNSNAHYNGRYRTGTISHRAGPRALADVVLFLDWHGDGRGYQRHEYTGSPTV
ncbi:hypothetical protein [Streptomyces sp. CB00455]|uniref:hypothetical protein n=1 Tax=Streptomyces sp. CB00455 TaxID=1703927 RepID=UPI0011612C61|nr:hypothetical protein [Streptomyces sp. CB00455]